MAAHKGNILLPLISAVAILALVVAGYLFYQNQQLTQKELNRIDPSPETVPAAKSPNEDLKVTTWKTYTYSPWNLSFQYPNNWFIYPDESSQNIRIQSYQKLEMGGGNPKGLYLLNVHKLPIQATNIAILINLLPKNGDVVQYLGDARTVSISNENSEPLNTYPYYTRNVTYKSDTSNVIETLHYLLDQKGNVIEIAPGLDVNGGKNITDQILSTFKFTDSTTVHNLNWPTYTSSLTGISFQYPKNYDSQRSTEVFESDGKNDGTALRSDREIHIAFPNSDVSLLNIYFYKSNFSALDWWNGEGVAKFNKLTKDFNDASNPPPTYHPPQFIVSSSIIGNQKAVIAKAFVDAAQRGNTIVSVVSLNGGIYMFEQLDQLPNGEALVKSNQIISTVKFL